MKITIPRLSTSNALTFCESLPVVEADDTYFFDVSQINNYEPLPMLLTSAAIRQFCEQRKLMPWDIQLLYEDNSDYTYACHMGYFQAAGFHQGKAPGEATGSSSYIPLTRINVRELQAKAVTDGNFGEQGDIIEIEAKRLAVVLSQGKIELRKLLQYLIREAMRNIPEHAGTNDIWICGQYWHNRNIAEIAILDEGIGVFESLKQNPVHRKYVTSNEEALRWAIQPGVSVAFNPALGQRSNDVCANSGYGLYMISEICRKTNGWFTFVSGEECLRAYPNNISICKTKFNGTALGIRIRTSNITNFQKIIDMVRKDGEAKAKEIKYAFKEASEPSKRLFLS